MEFYLRWSFPAKTNPNNLDPSSFFLFYFGRENPSPIIEEIVFDQRILTAESLRHDLTILEAKASRKKIRYTSSYKVDFDYIKFGDQ